jgi:hypothetical protein
MKKFILKLMLFSTPFVVWFSIVAWIDPFNFFNWKSKEEIEIRETKIRPLNSMLFNMIQYKHNPTEVIFIGDSRTRIVSDSLYRSITNQSTFNLYSNKAKLNEMIDLFWYAESFQKLKKVYFGVNFNLFNTYAFGARSKSNSELCNSPLKYITNRAVGEATGILLHLVSLSPDKKPNQKDFWKYNIEEKSADFYSKYNFPTEAVTQLSEIANYCKSHNIELTFVVLPHAAPMRKKVVHYNLSDQEALFKSTISGIGNTVDYDYENAITADTTNFGDPIHFKKHIGELIARELATKDFQVGRIQAQ